MDTQFKYEIRSLQLFWTLFWKIKVATEKCLKKKKNPECDAASSPYRKKRAENITLPQTCNSEANTPHGRFLGFNRYCQFVSL